MSPELQSILDFVEGRIDAKQFEQLLYDNPRFEELLNDDPHLKRNNYAWPSAYIYILQQDFNSLWCKIGI